MLNEGPRRSSFSPQIAAYPSNVSGHVPVFQARQNRGDVQKSRLVSTMTETSPEAIYKQQVAGRMRQARTAKGISQETLAGRIKKRRTHVNEWENAHHIPSWKNLVLLGEQLDVTPHWLLTGHDGP